MTRLNSDLAQLLDAKLRRYENSYPVLSFTNVGYRNAFIEQLVESVRRIKFIAVIQSRPVSILRANPSSDLFDPIKAAIYHQSLGNIDEAFWLVFISVHFGKNRRAGWRYAREVYGGSNIQPWNWEHTSSNPRAFRTWLSQNQTHLHRDGITKGFGNHRKYQSLSASISNGTGAAFETYINWVLEHNDHTGLITHAISQVGDDPKVVFDYLYKSMNNVASFGRMAKFDYLTMVGKLNLARITPGSAYLTGATGPYMGALLLFETRETKRRLIDNRLIQMDEFLEVGMQVIEDALCNWQKSPSQFKPFRG